MKFGKANPHDGDPKDEALSYVIGEMTPSEEAAFERRMEVDPALRGRVENWFQTHDIAREWALADPPGSSRISSITLETLAPPGEAGYEQRVPQKRGPWDWLVHQWKNNPAVAKFRFASAWVFTLAIIVVSLTVIWRSLHEKPGNPEPSFAKEPRVRQPNGQAHFPPF
ncbi:hypothetical protein HYR69_06760 [Candidatus Sumerlaeota bacterium]|nr:hypothetical protein [Candidatus Sumerlaeota bacterium]MBI3736780.1 hypothetical protein [Candidatus Sumerlaeota bacterium]